MAKYSKNSAVSMEIKKEYLKDHLENIKTVISTWLEQLNATAPFWPQRGYWGWQSLYRTIAEQDPDTNHSLRHHLRSRALWKNYAYWDTHIDKVWHLAQQLRKRTSKLHLRGSGYENRLYTADYLGTALYKGFGLALGEKVERDYRVPENEVGLCYQAYRIEDSIKNEEQRLLIETEHWDLINRIANLKVTRQLVDEWREAKELQERVREIANKDLKSNNILYPCRYCRHLWK